MRMDIVQVAFRFTPGELAFAVPAGVVVGAIIALAGVLITAQYNLQQARAERLWQQRATVYVDMLDALSEPSELFGQVSAWRGDWELPTVDQMEVFYTLEAKLIPRFNAFASDEAHDLGEQLFSAILELKSTLERPAADQTPPDIEDARGTALECGDLYDRLINTLRRDLQSG